MGRNNENATGLGFKAVAVLITLGVIAVIFSVAFSQKGNQVTAVFNAGIPVVAGVLGSALLGSISKLSAKRWGIYLFFLLAVGGFILLKLFRVF